MRIPSPAIILFLPSSHIWTTTHAFQSRIRRLSISHSKIFAEGSVGSIDSVVSTDEILKLKEELEQAQAFRQKMLQEIEEMEQKVTELNSATTETKSTFNARILAAREEAMKKKAEEDTARRKAEEEARFLAEEAAKKERMRQEAEKAARLLAEEKELLRKAEADRQALQDKMDTLKRQVELKKKQEAQDMGIAKNALEAGLAGGFIGAVLLARVMLEDREEKKKEIAEVVAPKRTQPVRMTFQIDDIAAKKPKGDKFPTKATTSNTKAMGIDSVPSSANGLKESKMYSNTSNLASSQQISKGTYIESLGGENSPAKQNSYSPFGSTPKAVSAPLNAPWLNDGKPAPINGSTPKESIPAPVSNINGGVGGLNSYTDSLGRNNGKSGIIPSSYSPFRSNPKSPSQPYSMNSQPSQTGPTSENGTSYMDAIIPKDVPTVLPDSSSPNGSSQLNNVPVTSSTESNGAPKISPQTTSQNSGRDSYLETITNDKGQPGRKSYSPFGRIAESKPWWENPATRIDD